MKECFIMISFKDMGYISNRVDLFMKVNGEKGVPKEKEQKNGQMVFLMKDNTNKERNMVKVFINGRMELYMMEDSEKIKSKEEVKLFLRIFDTKGIGKMV